MLALIGFLDQRELGGRPLTSARALKRVRSAVLLSDDRDLRDAALGEEADAVRMMTIHGAKGLEFPAVHVVGLHEHSLPGMFRQDSSPLPPGLIPSETRETHMEEEECLFFVAVSRAEDHLRLYHSELANVRSRNPSPFLTRIGALERSRLDVATEPLQISPAALTPVTTDQINLFDVRDYGKCALRIAYRRFLGVQGRRHESPFLQSAGVLYTLIDRLPEVAGKSLDQDLRPLLDEVWSDRGPVGNGLESDYLKLTRARVSTLAQLAGGFESPGFPTIDLPLVGGILTIGAPLVRSAQTGLEVRFFNAGRVGSKSGTDHSAGLLLAAARHAFGPRIGVSEGHVTGGAIVALAKKDNKVEEDVRAAGGILTAINSGRLPPKRNARVCGRCPHFFSCPAIGAPEI